MRKKIIAAILLVSSWFVYKLFFPTAEEVMAEFYRDVEGWVGEEVSFPLRFRSNLVKMHVIEAVQDKNMYRRQTALNFLGECKIVEALPVLLSILEDTTEEEVDRVVALKNIFLIDAEKGTALAEQYRGKGYIGSRADDILRGRFPGPPVSEDDPLYYYLQCR